MLYYVIYIILCYAVLYPVILYYTLLYYIMLCYNILHSVILYYTLLYYIVLCYTILYSVMLYYTILHSAMLYYRYWQLDVDSVGYDVWDRAVYEASEIYKGRMVTPSTVYL